MLYALLSCSDERCEAAYEAWGEPHELAGLTCELCGAGLRAVAYSEAGESARGRRAPELQLRDVA